MNNVCEWTLGTICKMNWEQNDSSIVCVRMNGLDRLICDDLGAIFGTHGNGNAKA